MEFEEHVALVDELLITAGSSVVKLNVVLIAAIEPGRRRLPMWDVEIMDALLPQQFFDSSDAARQQNLPGEHWSTDQEYWLPTDIY